MCECVLFFYNVMLFGCLFDLDLELGYFSFVSSAQSYFISVIQVIISSCQSESSSLDLPLDFVFVFFYTNWWSFFFWIINFSETL